MYAITGSNKDRDVNINPGASAVGLAGAGGGFEVAFSTSLPVPVISHPPPEQSRLQLVPSQCSKQFPPGQDMMHMSDFDSQYILQCPFVQV